MCLNKTLSYTIKVKSRTSELLILKKNDFLKLSINFKDLIDKHLQKSLYKFLRLIEKMNQIILDIEDGVEVTQLQPPYEAFQRLSDSIFDSENDIDKEEMKTTKDRTPNDLNIDRNREDENSSEGNFI